MNDADRYLTRTIVGECLTVHMGQRIVARTITLGQQRVDLRVGTRPVAEFWYERVLRLPAQDPWRVGRPEHLQGPLIRWANRYALLLAATGWMSALGLLALFIATR
jgi:hypothetical protein